LCRSSTIPPDRVFEVLNLQRTSGYANTCEKFKVNFKNLNLKKFKLKKNQVEKILVEKLQDVKFELEKF
jgi:hypothetical protein